MSDKAANRFIASARRTVKMEAEAVAELEARIDGTFNHACELLLATAGRVIVTGMGKSGHIANKVAAIPVCQKTTTKGHAGFESRWFTDR